MSQPSRRPADVAGRVAAALGSADLDEFADLLTPDARWGPPDDPVSGCHSREEVLAWYRTARDQGMRAEVTEVVAGPGKLLVGLHVSNAATAETSEEVQVGWVERWQVLTLRDGQVADIRGFDDRHEAAARAGLEH